MNCDSSQRLANWSYTTTGSPSLCVAHSLFVPDHSWSMSVAGRSTAPDLEYTAKLVFTISTYWVRPASPFVSGGRHEQLLACGHGWSPNGRHRPSKFWIGDEIGPVPFFFWTTGSLAVFVPEPRCSSSLSRAVTDVTGSATRTGRLLTAADTPSNRPSTTFGPKAVDVVARVVRATRSPPARTGSALSACTPSASASRTTPDAVVLSRETLPTRTAAPRMTSSTAIPMLDRFPFTSDSSRWVVPRMGIEAKTRSHFRCARMPNAPPLADGSASARPGWEN